MRRTGPNLFDVWSTKIGSWDFRYYPRGNHCLISPLLAERGPVGRKICSSFKKGCGQFWEKWHVSSPNHRLHVGCSGSVKKRWLPWLYSVYPLPRLHLRGGAFPPSRCLQALDVHFAEANGRASSKTTGVMAERSLVSLVSLMQICHDHSWSRWSSQSIPCDRKIRCQQLFSSVFALRVSQAAIFAETHASEFWQHISQ